VLSGGEIEVNREVSEIISEILHHLVRNAVDHGIEKREKRIEKGKPETGIIVVSAVNRGRTLVVQVIDDGRGIDIEKIRKAAEQHGTAGVTITKERMLGFLSEPGFSTKGEITDTSGRGVGLDIVSKKIHHIEGSSFRMVTAVGEGSVFTIEIPKGLRITDVVLVLCGGMTLAVPKKRIVSSLPVDKTKFRTGKNEELFYDEYPVFSHKGRVFASEQPQKEEYALILKQADKMYCLLADDVLFEKEIPESQMSFGNEISTGVYTVTINNNKTDFYYFDPVFS
jgi:chemotaxis protein histidine kinase CheA